MPGEPLNILMVEDDGGQARVMRVAIKGTGLPHQLEHVTELRSALEHVRQHPIDLVLLDLGLPDSFGIDTVRTMHEAAPDVPIVVLTALSDEEMAIEAVRQGAQDYLDKSQINARMLGRVIRYALERARTERELRQANERFRLAAAAAHEIIYDWDILQDTVFRSEGMSRVVGVPPEEAQPSRDWWLSRIHPDDLPRMRLTLDKALENGNTFIADYRVRHRDGHYVYIWDRGQIVRDAQGRPIRIVGGNLDVSERIRAEAETRRMNETLTALIRGSPLAMITVDRDGKVLTWNPAAEEIFQWKEKEVIGKYLPIVQDQAKSEFARLLSRGFQGRTRRGIELKRRRKDGTLIDICMSTSAIHDHTGKVVAVMSILEDITQRKHNEEERARLQEQLHQTQKLEAVGQLAAGVAHDFNNLLTVILGNVDRMNKLLGDEDERRSVLAMIEEAARQATGVTRSLLTFSHKIPSVKRPTNLTAAVQESARLLQRLLPASVELQVRLPEEPMWVIGDRSQLQQVIINLAINARDAMPTGGKIEIELTRAAARDRPRTANHSEQEIATLSISDTGVGIPAEVLPHIFDPFFTTKPRGQGTGLGLAIVRSILQDHHGDISVVTKVGEGSTFTATLPIESIEAPREHAEEDIRRGNGELILPFQHSGIRSLEFT